MLKLWRRPDAKQGIWRVRGTLGGRRYDESTGTDSRAHAEAILARRQKEILDRLTWGPERTTVFAEAAALYVTNGGEARFLEPLVRAFGPRRLADITQADVVEFIGIRYPDTGMQGINRQVYTPLIAIYRFAAKAGLGPASIFQRPKIKRKGAVRFATDDDLNRLLPHCSDRLRGAILLMSLGGARASEACRVVETDIDWSRASVTLQETKNGTPRVISAGAVLMAGLQPLMGTAGGLFGFSGRYSLNQALARACLRAGFLDPFSTHEVGRHAFAARHLREGRTLLEVQKLGGWKSYRMVAEVYGHLERSKLDDAMRTSGAMIDLPPPTAVPDPVPSNVVRFKQPGRQQRALTEQFGIIHDIPDGTLALYIISSDQYRKIGVTSNITKRLAQLQDTNPVVIYLDHYEMAPKAMAFAAESHAHFLLRMRHVHKRGEWFECTLDLAREALAAGLEHAFKKTERDLG